MKARGFWLVLFSAGLTAGANLLLRIGVDRAGRFAFALTNSPSAQLRLVCQPLFDPGVTLYGLAPLVWFRVFTSEHLSIAYPLLVSLTSIFVTLGAVALFQESLTWRKLLGLTIILFGILVVTGV